MITTYSSTGRYASLRKRMLFAAAVFALVVIFLATAPSPALADDCSGPQDCANVIQGSGVLAMILAALLGASAAKSKSKGVPRPSERKKKFKDCRAFNDWLSQSSEGDIGEAEPFLKPTVRMGDSVPTDDGGFTVTAKVEWRYTPSSSKTWVLRPHWDGMSDAEKDAVNDWIERIKEHENGHHEIARRHASTAGEELIGEGHSNQAAREDLQRKLEEHKDSTQASLDKATTDYDIQTRNGQAQVKVGGRNTTFSCPGA